MVNRDSTFFKKLTGLESKFHQSFSRTENSCCDNLGSPRQCFNIFSLQRLAFLSDRVDQPIEVRSIHSRTRPANYAAAQRRYVSADQFKEMKMRQVTSAIQPETQGKWITFQN